MKFNHYTLLIGVGLLAACKSSTMEESKVELETLPEVFVGHVRYEINIVSSDSDDIRTFFTFSPSEIEIWFGDSTFRMIEHGGVSRGNIAINLRQATAYQIDTLQRKVYRGIYSDFNNASEDLKRLMPDHYKPLLKATGNRKNIHGLDCLEYQVVRSGFTRPEAKTFVWVSRDINLPAARYDIESSINRVTSPLPMYMGIQEGSVVELKYFVDNMEVCYSLKVENNILMPTSFFEPPVDYLLE